MLRRLRMDRATSNVLFWFINISELIWSGKVVDIEQQRQLQSWTVFDPGNCLLCQQCLLYQVEMAICSQHGQISKMTKEDTSQADGYSLALWNRFAFNWLIHTSHFIIHCRTILDGLLALKAASLDWHVHAFTCISQILRFTLSFNNHSLSLTHITTRSQRSDKPAQVHKKKFKYVKTSNTSKTIANSSRSSCNGTNHRYAAGNFSLNLCRTRCSGTTNCHRDFSIQQDSSRRIFLGISGLPLESSRLTSWTAFKYEMWWQM